MNKILSIALAVLLLTSCKKEKPADQNLKAQTEKNVAYGLDAFHRMDVYLPAGRSVDSTKLMVLVHGGAWVSGDKTDFSSFIPVIQQRFPDYAIANINYRLANSTDNYFPAQENDMSAAIDYLIKMSKDYNISKKLCCLEPVQVHTWLYYKLINIHLLKFWR